MAFGVYPGEPSKSAIDEMTIYEFITSGLALIAVVISGYTLMAQRKLQRITSELARKQSEVITREEKADIKLALVRQGSLFRFVIRNVSAVDARNVNLELLLDDPNNSPLMSAESKEKLPAPKLSAGSSLSLIASLQLKSQRAYHAKLTWTNPDGSEAIEETFVSL